MAIGNGKPELEQRVSTYTIRSDVKLPLYRTKYPFGKMKVGDSFAVAQEDVRRVRASASQFGGRHKIRFGIRCVDLVSKSYRCWRVA